MNRRDVREEVRAVARALDSPHFMMWRFDNGYNEPPSHVRMPGGSWLKPGDANWLGLVRLARQLLANRPGAAPAVREEKERPRA